MDRLASLLWSPERSHDHVSLLDDCSSTRGNGSLCVATSSVDGRLQPIDGHCSNRGLDSSKAHYGGQSVPHASRSRSPKRNKPRRQIRCASWPSSDLSLLLQPDDSIEVAVCEMSTNPGKIFDHCLCAIEGFRGRMGGCLAVFKIGITSDVLPRFAFYREDRFKKMCILHECFS
jgi:hypothetical protein